MRFSVNTKELRFPSPADVISVIARESAELARFEFRQPPLLTKKEIAEILGRNEATIRSDLKRAREKLKKILKEDYDFGEI